MKEIISKINKQLIYKYPNIWNVRLVWMLLFALVLHLMFFSTGYFILSNPSRLHKGLTDNILLGDYGISMLSIIISIVSLVSWAVYLFKNNAFKNFYPTSGIKIYWSFIYFLIIILANSSYYLSFMLGYKVYIANKYSIERIENQEYKSNLSAIFLNQNLSDYSIISKRYPAPYDSLYVTTDENIIQNEQAFYPFGGGRLQYFKVDKKFVVTKDYKVRDSINSISLTTKFGSNETLFYWVKGQVVALETPPDTNYTYFNYASMPFDHENRYYYPYYKSYYNDDIEQINRLKPYLEQWHQWLNNKDTQGISQSLNDFLAICKEYKIDNNLDIDRWLQIVFHHPDFRIDSFIHIPKDYYEYGYGSTTDSVVYSVEEDAFEPAIEYENQYGKYLSDYQKNRKTNMYLNLEQLQNSFYSLYSLRNFDSLKSFSKFQMYFSLSLALFLFMFRVTNLKSLIFSGLTAAVLLVFILLITLTSVRFFNSGEPDLDVKIMIFVILSLVLWLPFLMRSGLSKLIQGVHINLMLGTWVLYLLLMIMMIDDVLSMNFRLSQPEGVLSTETYTSIFTIYENLIFYGLWFMGVLFPLIFVNYIKKWKGSPEQ